jgi:Uma2 family endonuclease
MADIASPPTGLTIDDMPWPDIELPPTDLPSDDGDNTMESSWHADAGPLLKYCVIAAHGGRRDDYYVANNMFVYFSLDQVRNKDYKGPDVFVVKGVDGRRHRDSWIAWVENGRLPDVIFELLSPSTRDEDLGPKKQLYERTFHTHEYFCIGYEVSELLGWRLKDMRYEPIAPDERGWLWSEELQVWLGGWRGAYVGEERVWPRLYTADGNLVLLPDEAATLNAEAERQRAGELAARLAALEAELNRLRGGA